MTAAQAESLLIHAAPQSTEAFVAVLVSIVRDAITGDALVLQAFDTILEYAGVGEAEW